MFIMTVPLILSVYTYLHATLFAMVAVVFVVTHSICCVLSFFDFCFWFNPYIDLRWLSSSTCYITCQSDLFSSSSDWKRKGTCSIMQNFAFYLTFVRVLDSSDSSFRNNDLTPLDRVLRAPVYPIRSACVSLVLQIGFLIALWWFLLFIFNKFARCYSYLQSGTHLLWFVYVH